MKVFGGGSACAASLGPDSNSEGFIGIGRMETSSIVVGGMQCERDGATRMHADARDRDVVPQRCLLDTLHQIYAGLLAARPIPGSWRSHTLAFKSAASAIQKASPLTPKSPFTPCNLDQTPAFPNSRLLTNCYSFLP